MSLTIHRKLMAMDASLFCACAARLHTLQAMYITFATGQGGVAGLRRLMTIAQSSTFFRIEQSQVMMLQCVAESGRWEHVSRTVTVYGIMKVHPSLLESLARDIESIHAGDHFAKAIFTSSEKKQHAATTDILLAVLNTAVLNEVEGYGVRVDGRLCSIDGIPAITFSFFKKASNEKLVELSIDGFSGRYAIGDAWGDRRFISAKDVQERMYSVLTDCLDKLTE